MRQSLYKGENDRSSNPRRSRRGGSLDRLKVSLPMYFMSQAMPGMCQRDERVSHMFMDKSKEIWNP